MTKPFRVEEVVARIRAIVRRANGFASPQFEFSGLVLDTRTKQVSRDGVPISLTPQEYKLVAYLAHQQGRVVSQLEITWLTAPPRCCAAAVNAAAAAS